MTAALRTTPQLPEPDSDLLIDQLRAIDNRRLTQGPLSHVDKGLMNLVADALKEVLGIDSDPDPH